MKIDEIKDGIVIDASPYEITVDFGIRGIRKLGKYGLKYCKHKVFNNAGLLQ